jgi:hypothetical protein
MRRGPIPAPIEELRKKSCAKGHSRHDALVVCNARYGTLVLQCRVCHAENSRQLPARRKVSIKLSNVAKGGE